MQLESKSRCDCWNMKWFLTDATAYRHSLNIWPAASQLAGSSDTANLSDFKSPVHTHNSEFQSNSQILLLYTRVEDIQHNESQKRTSFKCNGLWLSFQGSQVWRQPTKLWAFLAKCKINLDFNLWKTVNLMTRNCVHLKPAAVTCYTRIQSCSLLTRNQKHFAGTDEEPFLEERLNYLMEQAKSPFIKEFSGLSFHIMFLKKSILAPRAACRPSSWSLQGW